ncbi:hypothetical protein BDN72DRAFT_897574 [Pluteus cervinus]|uniref:Uncharacterized protein n=1 Tax=Pluteus cervinus TaxID=181527 RepID=A0ACD3AT19_9AGAR|nr:hypothetical protein BDN72DRAFT_897574 [Pluteus cervinus]
MSSCTETGLSDAHARRTALQRELDAGTRCDGGVEFLRQTFKDVVARRTITSFLTKSKSYDMQKKRWHILPSNPSSEEDLHPKVHEILKEILKFRQFATDNRKLVYCDDYEINHPQGDLSAHELDPDFMILGRGGASFKEQKFPISPTYSQCVSLIQVTPSGNPQDLQSHIALVATYARQCFIEQHNRLKVYAVLLTESTMWLFQFDRSGFTYSTGCDIHADPHTFVRVLLGLASDDARVGFDTSIFWERGRRWIRTRNHKGRRVAYLVKGDKPIAHREVLVGRATCCWRVIDPYTDREYIVKDVWRLLGDEPETNLLETASGLAGVGQLVSSEEDHTKTTAHLRGTTSANALPTDRIWSRMTLEAYGDCLEHFSDGLQLLKAFRDIVLAIFDLWERRVLHRDISINNTLLGKENALPGSRGVLIDLDRAMSRKAHTVRDPVSYGTRAFQSIAVLRSDTVREDTEAQGSLGVGPYPHDYLDDIESLFYVLCWVCSHYEAPGVRTGGFSRVFRNWMSPDPEASADAKLKFLLFPLPALPAYFQRGSAFKHLLEKLHQKFLPIAQSKPCGIEDDKKGATLEEMCRNTRSESEVLLADIDQAIKDWENGTSGPPEVAVPALALKATGEKRERPKDPSDDGVDTNPPPKRRSTNPLNSQEHNMFQFKTFFIIFGALFALVATTPLAVSESQVGVNPATTPPRDHHQYTGSSLEQSATQPRPKELTGHFDSNAKKLKYRRYSGRRSQPTFAVRAEPVKRDVVNDVFNLILDLSSGQLERLFDLLDGSFVPSSGRGDVDPKRNPNNPLEKGEAFAITFLVEPGSAPHASH